MSPCWEYLHSGNQQTLQLGAFSFFPERGLLNVHQRVLQVRKEGKKEMVHVLCGTASLQDAGLAPLTTTYGDQTPCSKGKRI